MELSDARRKRLADMFEKIGHIFLASLVVPFFLADANLLVSVTGALVSFGCFAMSLRFEES